MMKVLVVDDELPIRQWLASVLRNMREPKVEVTGVAANGEQALAMYHEQKPDVILADITMPVLDGISLLKIIREESFDTEVVFLTCHEDFSYAREAIANAASDYILKTEITPQRLSELLLKIQNSKDNRRNRHSVHEWVDIQTQQEHFLKYLLKAAEVQTEQELEHQLNAHHIHLSKEGMFANAFYKTSSPGDEMQENAVGILDERVGHVVYFPYSAEIGIVLGNLLEVSSLLYQKNTQYEFARKLANRFHSSVGISEIYYHLTQIPKMIQESVYALSLDFYKSQMIYQSLEGRNYQEAEKELLEQREGILALVNEDETDLALTCIRHLLEGIKKQPVYETDQLKRYFASIAAGILLHCHSDRPQLLPEKMTDSYERLVRTASIDEVSAFFTELLEEERSRLEDQKNSYSQHIVRLIRYVGTHYASCSITDTASAIGLNADYLGRLMKKELGATFSQYLTSVRMNKAIELLQNSDHKVYEIAEEVGYQNFSYFSTSFKKQFGISPFEFRNKSSRA